jgi:hypothetical protein
MGFWYLLSILVGVILYVKFTFFNKEIHWKTALSAQLPIVALLLIFFGIFMLLPMSTRLIDLLFS